MKFTDKIAERLNNGTATVLGFGISNRPLVRHLLSLGCKITVRDAKNAETLGDEYKEFSAKGVEFILGEKYLDGICEDVIFRSPGIRPDAGSISSAVNNGSLLTSEMEWFLSVTPAYVLAVTGSDGKTTTTTLTYKLLEKEMLHTDRNVYVGGNIGKPLLPECSNMKKGDFAVVELSSFQLQNLSSPIDRAVITNITPNHLNWHIDMDEYSAAKQRIYSSSDTSLLVVNANDERTRTAGLLFPKKTAFFSYNPIPKECLLKPNSFALTVKDGCITHIENETEKKVLALSDIKLPGKHNVENYMAAIANTWGLVSLETITEIAKTFGGVEHRLEFVRELDGIKYYNSSIDSSPTRTAAALSALQEKPVIICGGYDKHIPFDPLADALARRAKAVVLTGATREKILSAIDVCKEFDKAAIPIVAEADFEAAVNAARKLAKGGGTVLLSPACASFDAFPNFEVRGNTFKSIVSNFKSELK